MVVILIVVWYNLVVFNDNERADFMYFDPGTGSMVIQMVIASIAGVGAFFVTFKTNFIGFVKELFKKNGK